MHKPVEFRVAHIAHHQEADAQSTLGVTIVSDTSTYEEVTLRVLEYPEDRVVGGKWGDVALPGDEVVVRIQNPEMMRQFQLGDVVALTIKPRSRGT